MGVIREHSPLAPARTREVPRGAATIRYEPSPGQYLPRACEHAVGVADRARSPVAFAFNGTEVVASPGDDPISVQGRWWAERGRQDEARRPSAPHAVDSLARLRAELDGARRERDRLREALETAVAAAKLARWHWDRDRHAKVGKLLFALAGDLPGYRAQIDEIHACLADGAAAGPGGEG